MKEIEKTIALEGGYVCDPADNGGETKFGISKKAFPNVDIKNLTKEMAVELYREHYWNKLHLDSYTNIQFRWKLFDIAVNQGVGTAMSFIMLLQKPKDTQEAVFELAEMQMKRYINLVIGKPVLLRFLRGWGNRAFDLGEDLI